MIGLLRRFANRQLTRDVTRLRADLDAERLKTKVVEAERDNLALVLARDRSRIESEIAAYQRVKADSEGVADERRNQ